MAKLKAAEQKMKKGKKPRTQYQYEREQSTLKEADQSTFAIWHCKPTGKGSVTDNDIQATSSMLCLRGDREHDNDILAASSMLFQLRGDSAHAHDKERISVAERGQREVARRRNYDVGVDHLRLLSALAEARSSPLLADLNAIADKNGIPVRVLRGRLNQSNEGERRRRGRPKGSKAKQREGVAEKKKQQKPPSCDTSYQHIDCIEGDISPKIMNHVRKYDREAYLWASVEGERSPLQRSVKRDSRLSSNNTKCSENMEKRIECNSRNCFWGENSLCCSNRRSQTPYLSRCCSRPWIVNEKVIGFELFAMSDIPRYKFLGQYVGVLESEIRLVPKPNGKGVKIKGNRREGGFYDAAIDLIVDANDNLDLVTPSEDIKKYKCEFNCIVNAEKKENLTRYINHSCDPNCKLEVWIINCQPQLWFVTTKFIKKGDSITFDYGTDAFKFFDNKRCLCQSTKCKYL